jgi:glycosyltransferase involved in cell wall biosynthesis
MEQNKKRTKVLHLIASGGMYGAESVILNLSLEMQKSGVYEPIVGCIVQERLEVPALCEAARSKAIRTELFRIKNTRLPVHFVRFLRQLKAIGPDIVHSHGYKPSVFGYLAGKMMGIPITATCHLWYVDDHSPLTMRLMIRLEKAVYRRFPMVFAVSSVIRETLLALGVSDTRVHLVNNGIPLPISGACDGATARQIAARFGIHRGEICIVNAGRLTHQKSQKTIIEAARLLQNRGRRFKFVIAGEGELRHELQSQIAEERLNDVIQLVGFTDRIADLLSIATLFVLPSRDEGMPMSLLEAVACRVPVVATNVGAIGNIIKDKVSGLLIPPESPQELAAAIQEIVDDPARSKSFSERAYELLAANYSSAAMFKQYDHYYRLILQGISQTTVE